MNKFIWRSVVCLIALLSASTEPRIAVASEPAGAEQPEMRARIVLLGTSAGPVPRSDRSQPATALVVDGKTYLIDAGDNVSQQLVRAHLLAPNLNAIFLTHLHFDHTLGLGPLMAFTWTGPRTQPIPVYGPPGTAELVRRNGEALAIGVEIFKPQLPPRPPLSELFPVREGDLTEPRQIYADDVVRISAVANSHYETAHLPSRDYGLDRSLSYRFETSAGTIVFTGDTGPSQAVEALARGCDILVSEVVDQPSITAALAAQYGSADDPRLASLRLHMEAEHLTPTEVGKLAQRAKTKKLVLTHFAVGPGADIAQLIRQIRQEFPEGEIVAGADLMEIPLHQRKY